MSRWKPSNSINRHIAIRLKKRRNDYGLSQSQLADVLDISLSQYQKYEKAINAIGGDKLYVLAHELGVCVSYFYEDFKGSVSAATR